jgi:iron complex outermembrane receptor protein
MKNPQYFPHASRSVLDAAGIAAASAGFAAALVATFVAPPAIAQQADGSAAAPPSTQLAPVIVTGTRAKDRTELNSALPVDILAAEDLRSVAGPEANLGQALASLLPSFNYLDQSNSGSADHVRAAQLRGLNPDQVLVLINGKRVHPTAIVNVESAVGLGSVAVDFASIPVNAVKRVEVLRDGAGAQYGSDAIAGVINVILDESAAGGDFGLDAGQFRTKFAPTGQSLHDGATTGLQGSYGFALPGSGFVRLGVDASHHNPTNRAGFDTFYPNAAFFTFNPDANVVTFRVGDAEVKNLNLWVNSGFELGRARGYATALYNHRTSRGDAFFREPNDTNANTGSPSNNVLSVYPNGFLPESTGTNRDLHLNAGARGEIAQGWKYDASLTYGLNDFSYGLDHSINASYGASSPTSFHLGDFRFTQTTGNLDFSGDLALGGWTPTLALGAEARREGYRTGAGDPASYLQGTGAGSDPAGAAGAQGDLGLQPANVSSSTRTVAGTYVDLSSSFTPTLFGEAAARFDHYSDAGSATTGKVSGRWDFARGWGLRAALSSNFRAPALAQVSSAYSPSTYVAGGTLGIVNIVPVSSPVAQALGAQALKPERSRNASVGLTLQTEHGLAISLDWFHVDISDRIALSQQIPFAGGAAGSAGNYEFFTNAVDTVTRGADLVAAWTTKLAGGELRLSDASTVNSNTIRDIHAQPANITAIANQNGIGPELLFGLQAQNAITTALPKRRDVLSAHWSSASWGLLGRATHNSEVTRVFDFSSPNSPYVVQQTYGATWQLDLEGEWKPTKALAAAIGVQNLTDRYPTRSDSDINYGGNLPYDFLSPIGFNGRYCYLRLRYSLQ